MSMLRSFWLTIPTTLNASLISHKSISSGLSSAFLSANGIASDGAIVKSIGLVSASAYATIRASGTKFLC